MRRKCGIILAILKAADPCTTSHLLEPQECCLPKSGQPCRRMPRSGCPPTRRRTQTRTEPPLNEPSQFGSSLERNPGRIFPNVHQVRPLLVKSESDRSIAVGDINCAGLDESQMLGIRPPFTSWCLSTLTIDAPYETERYEYLEAMVRLSD